jgi:hypothetical protein
MCRLRPIAIGVVDGKDTDANLANQKALGRSHFDVRETAFHHERG